MAEAQQFHYEIEVIWNGEAASEIRASGRPEIPVGAPPEFRGTEGRWSPEHLFAAAAATCFMLTFLAVAKSARLAVLDYSASARAKLEKISAGRFEITEIAIRPRIVVGTAEDMGRVPRLLEKTKQRCFITNSIKSRVVVEPEVFHRRTPAVPCPPG
ncbi:MAG TPA: OsmC family protein [candidate division Zixibacteria bacterium]|nr:OsmC family protein [candidate division Zixibacteria bacterium]